MVLTIVSALLFGLINTFLYFIFFRKKTTVRLYLFFLFSLMHLFSYYGFSLYQLYPQLRQPIMNPDHIFYSAGAFDLRIYLLSVGLSVLFAFLVYCFAILRKNASQISYCKSLWAASLPGGKSEAKKMYPIIPFVSIKYAVLILLLCVFALIAMQYLQPDYHTWEAENRARQAMHEQMLLHMVNNTSYEAGNYPLWQRKGADYEYDASPSKKNILVLSDSFGHYYAHSDVNQLFWKQLDKVLKQRGYHDINVISVGIGGDPTYAYMRRLRDTPMLEDLNPEIVIITYVTNDADFYEGAENVKLYYPTDIFDTILPLRYFKNFFPDVAYSINSLLPQKRPPETYNDETGYPYQMHELEIISGRHLLDFYEYAVKPLGETIARMDMPAFVVTVPIFPDADYYEPRYQPVLPLFEKAGITVYDSLPDMIAANFDAVDMENTMINPSDSHPGPASTFFYANYLADVLERDYPELLGERNTVAPLYDIHVNYAMPASLGPDVRFESPARAEYEIIYPAASAALSFLNLPVGQDYVKLCFRYPVAIKSVRFESDFLEQLTLYTTRIDPDRGYDTQMMFDEGTQTGTKLFFELEGDNMVTALCFSAIMAKGQSAKVAITVEAADKGVRP